MPPISPSSPTPSPTDSLIALKTQYERSLTEANTNASLLREQLSHVNALLLDRLLQGNGVAPQQTQSGSDVPVEAIAPAPAQSLAISPAAEAPAPIPKTKASPRPSEAVPEPASGKRIPRPLLPAYRGLTRLEAIAQVLQATPGEDVTADRISEGLFGQLSAADRKAECKSLNTQLHKGKSLNLWQKGTVRGTFLIGSPTSSAKPKRPGRKPDPTKEPQPEPVAEVAIAEAPVSKARAAKPKSGRETAIAKAQASKKPARSKRSVAELLELLQKADIQV
jgi:hypothetical protein